MPKVEPKGIAGVEDPNVGLAENELAKFEEVPTDKSADGAVGGTGCRVGFCIEKPPVSCRQEKEKVRFFSQDTKPLNWYTPGEDEHNNKETMFVPL